MIETGQPVENQAVTKDGVDKVERQAERKAGQPSAGAGLHRPSDDSIRSSWERPGSADFGQWLETRVARHSTRRYDWDALKFQADHDPRYRRAQMRYVGTGATGVASDTATVPAGNFTFSTMLIPAGGIGPMHIHYDVEEVFFVMRGRMRVICEKDGERWETELGERDLISVPPGVYREEHNIGEEDALMCVMLGSPKPVTPTYPPDSPLARIQRG